MESKRGVKLISTKYEKIALFFMSS